MTRPVAILALLGASTTALAADDFSFIVDQVASSVALSTSLSALSDGTLIGDYDAATNPSGTQTRPGLFGGSGNNPIPLSVDFLFSSTISTSPTGAFSISADTDALTVLIDALAVDLLAGDTAESGIDATFVWDTFNTINPTGFFPGGIPLTLPLSTSQLTTFTLAQSGPMTTPGVLVPDMAPGVYTLAATVPTTITIAADSLTTPIPETAFDVQLPVVGTLTINNDATASITLSLDLASLSQEIDLSAAPPIEGLAFDLPTISGDPAHVLLTLAFSTATLNNSGAVTLVANAQPAGCNASDLAEPFGVLDFSDVIAFLTAFGSADPIADLAEPSGVLDFSDVLAFLTAFGSGCP